MGNKALKAVIILCVSFLLKPTTVFASTAEDLYKVYNIKFEAEYPENVLSTIQKYDNAKKYLSMYKYVALSDYDESIINKKIDNLIEEKNKIEEQLLSGYNLSLSDIYALEDKYVTVCKQLNDAESTSKTYSVEFNKPEPDSVPTYKEYIEAKRIKASIDTQMDIGDLDNVNPVTTAYLIDECSDNVITLDVPDSATVVSLFNGEIARIDTDGITINHYNGIYTFYGGVNNVYVDVGDTVYQGQAVGTVDENLILKCKVGNKIVDINKLFEKE